VLLHINGRINTDDCWKNHEQVIANLTRKYEEDGKLLSLFLVTFESAARSGELGGKDAHRFVLDIKWPETKKLPEYEGTKCPRGYYVVNPDRCVREADRLIFELCKRTGVCAE
jgi:hypothetical protein